MAAAAITSKALTLRGGGASPMLSTDLYVPGSTGAGQDTMAYAKVNPGQIAHDKNGNEFILLPGAASTVAGDAVIYNPSTFATTRLKTGAVGPVAIAQAACNATTSFGWYLIRGYAEKINTSLALAINVQLYVNVGTSTGCVTDTYAAGAQVHGAVSVTSTTAADAGITAYIGYPWVNAKSDS